MDKGEAAAGNEFLETKNHWEKVYSSKTYSEVSWFQNRPSLSLSLVERHLKNNEGPIIDVGGGSSNLVDFLIGMGYRNISVLDISENGLSQSRKRLGLTGEKINWIVADITSFRPEIQYDLWHDRAVLHFLTEEAEQELYRKTLLLSTHPGSIVVIATFHTTGPDRCSGLGIKQYDRSMIENVVGEEFQFLEEAREEHLTPAAKTQQFIYCVFQRK